MVAIPKIMDNYLQMISDLVILNGALALAFTVCRDWEYFLAFRDLYLLILRCFPCCHF